MPPSRVAKGHWIYETSKKPSSSNNNEAEQSLDFGTDLWPCVYHQMKNVNRFTSPALRPVGLLAVPAVKHRILTCPVSGQCEQ